MHIDYSCPIQNVPKRYFLFRHDGEDSHDPATKESLRRNKDYWEALKTASLVATIWVNINF